MFASSYDVDVTNGGLELDQGMGLVVSVRRARLALGAEVHIVTNGTLVAVADNVVIARAVIVVAQRAIAAYSDVGQSAGDRANVGRLEWLVDRNEPMAGMNKLGRLVAGRAIVPVRALKALVPNTADVLLTAIADSVVELVAARSKTALHLRLGTSPGYHRGKGVLGVMSVAILGKADLAKIEVVTCLAMDKFGLRQVLNAAVAGAQSSL